MGSDQSVEPKAMKIKASLALDPEDESECKAFPVGDQAQVARWFKNYEDLKGVLPLIEEAEPTQEQILAMEARVVGMRLETYGDPSILTP
eukprot:6374680-Amphidinium_carterae.1